MRITASIFGVLSCLLSAWPGSARAEERPATALWATHAMDRVMRDRPMNTDWEPQLHAAKGEWEALQVIVSGAPEDVQGVLLASTSLKGPDGAFIPAPVLLREHYVAVTKSSELAPLPTGDYPDALVPQTFPWQPLPSLRRVNQPFWVDVYVPPDATPGDYTGKVTATLATGQKLSQDFKLHVWNFELPRLPAMKSSIFMVWRRIAKIHGFNPDASRAEPKLQRILNAYYDMLVDNRLSPHEVWQAYPDADNPLGEKSYAQIERALVEHLLQRQAGTIGLPLWPTWPLADPLGLDRQAAMEYVVRYYRICEKLGCASRLYKIFGELDEPNDMKAYSQVRAWGRFFHEIHDKYGVKVPLTVTEQPTPDNPAWGSLTDAVDIWVPHVSSVWTDMEAANGPREIPKRIAAGQEVWTYTALVQAPDEWKVSHGRPKKILAGQPPVWLTDYPAINYRILGWLMPRYGITGLTYWDTSYWRNDNHDVWQNAGTYPHDNGDVYNGDGFLIYPAREGREGFEGPVASIRLKWLRECADDYDYLHLLMERGFKNFAIDGSSNFARGFGDWDDNVAGLYQTRLVMGGLLEKLISRSRKSP